MQSLHHAIAAEESIMSEDYSDPRHVPISFRELENHRVMQQITVTFEFFSRLLIRFPSASRYYAKWKTG